MAQEMVADSKKSNSLQSMAAAILILTVVVEILTMWHHPHVQTHDRLQATLQIISVSHLAGWIHGLAIGSALVIAYCLGESLRNQVPGPLMRAAALLYGAGLVGWISAATVDGWVLERLAGTLAHETAADLEANARLFAFCMAWVVASTNIGVVLTSVAIFAVSAGLLRKGRSWQLAGMLGMLVGGALSFSIVAGNLTMDGHGAIVAVGSQGLWLVALGVVSLKATWRA
jgi:hypothetical protein